MVTRLPDQFCRGKRSPLSREFESNRVDILDKMSIFTTDIEYQRAYNRNKDEYVGGQAQSSGAKET